MDKQQIQARQQEILDLIKEFTDKKLDKDYFNLAKKMLQKLGRENDVPFMTGQPKIWAAAIINALGTINFLFDKSFKPYVSVEELNAFFGTSKSTTANKAKQIREMLDLRHYDPEFSTKKMQEDNPFNKFVMVDGMITLLDTLPEDLQEMVRQARAEGKEISFFTK
jgi:hypothetical protein